MRPHCSDLYRRCLLSNRAVSMVEELQMPQRGPRGVRDVPAEQFIRAYAEHLKANDKVSVCRRIAWSLKMC